MRSAIAESAPWPYCPPAHLEQPSSDPTFDVVRQRIARFARDGLLDIGARILWTSWQSDARPAWDDAGFSAVEVYGPQLIGLAAMFCPGAGINPDAMDFCLLCWEL
jgi:hypothetical protein